VYRVDNNLRVGGMRIGKAIGKAASAFPARRDLPRASSSRLLRASDQARDSESAM